MIQTRCFHLAIFGLAICLAGCSSSSSHSGGDTPPGVHITAPPSAPTIGLGQSVNFQAVVGSNASTGVTWSLQKGQGCKAPVGNLTNMTANSATYTAPSTSPSKCGAPNPAFVTVVATSNADNSQSALVTVVIVQSQPVIATTVTFPTCPVAPNNIIQPPITAGRPFNQTSQVGVFTSIEIDDASDNGVFFGVAPFTWKLTGTLPSGLTLGPGTDSTSVLVTGTPVSSGCFPFTMQITDATGVSSPPVTFNIVVIPSSLKVQVSPYSTPLIDSTTNQGIPYPPTAMTVTGGQGPYTWNLLLPDSEPLPVGMTLTVVPGSGAAVVSGVPDPSNLNQVNFKVPFVVSDNQQPYPAVGLPTMTLNVLPSVASCAPDTTLPALLDPNGPTGNGGILGGNQVLVDNYMQGSYVFMLRGFHGTDPVVIAGSVTLDGQGKVMGGEEDITSSKGSRNLQILPDSSSYTVGYQGNNNRGCMALATSSGTTTFNFTLGGCSNSYTGDTSTNACRMTQDAQNNNIPAGNFSSGRVIEFDDATGNGTRVSGILRLQDQSSFAGGLSGPYAFGWTGWDVNQGHYAIAGSFKSSGGSLTSIAADIDDAGSVNSKLTGGSGAFGSVDSNGRAETTTPVTVGPASFNLALYMVSKNHAVVVSNITPDATHPILSGEAITTAGSFSNELLANTHMFQISGSASTGPDVSLGTLTFDGVGSFSGTAFQDQAATLGTASLSGVYAVDPASGRVEFSAPQLNNSLGPHPVVAYLIPPPTNLTRAACRDTVSCVTGFLVGNDSSAQDGVLEFQTSVSAPPPPFTNQYVLGTYAYGTQETLQSETATFEGTVLANPSASSITAGNFTTNVQDINYGDHKYCGKPGCLLLLSAESLTAGYSINSNGTGTFGGGTVSVTNGSVVFYIDESPLNLWPVIAVAEQ